MTSRPTGPFAPGQCAAVSYDRSQALRWDPVHPGQADSNLPELVLRLGCGLWAPARAPAQTATAAVRGHAGAPSVISRAVHVSPKTDVRWWRRNIGALAVSTWAHDYAEGCWRAMLAQPAFQVQTPCRSPGRRRARYACNRTLQSTSYALGRAYISRPAADRTHRLTVTRRCRAISVRQILLDRPPAGGGGPRADQFRQLLVSGYVVKYSCAAEALSGASRAACAEGASCCPAISDALAGRDRHLARRPCPALSHQG